MKTIKVELGDRSYDILIGSNLLNRAADLLCETLSTEKCVIITNPTIDNLYGNKLKELLLNSGLIVNLLTVPDGEEYKSLDTAGRLYKELTDCFSERGTPVLALGGGVIGDLSGFVAATYMRGVPFIQIPTTLLAQVDSSIGGKVGIDHGKLKNRIGAFYQPKLVISDTTTLKTLPQKEFANGMAEVIKSAIIRDRSFFNFIRENLAAITKQDGDIIDETVFRAASIKASTVIQDERDTGLRNILNFGHTIGHAVESVSGFKISHGQAVAIGMIAEIEELISDCGLSTSLPELDRDNILQAIQHDKKVANGKVRLALPRNIGNVYITDEVESVIIREALEE